MHFSFSCSTFPAICFKAGVPRISGSIFQGTIHFGLFYFSLQRLYPAFPATLPRSVNEKMIPFSLHKSLERKIRPREQEWVTGPGASWDFCSEHCLLKYTTYGIQGICCQPLMNFSEAGSAQELEIAIGEKAVSRSWMKRIYLPSCVNRSLPKQGNGGFGWDVCMCACMCMCMCPCDFHSENGIGH